MLCKVIEKNQNQHSVVLLKNGCHFRRNSTHEICFFHMNPWENFLQTSDCAMHLVINRAVTPISNFTSFLWCEGGTSTFIGQGHKDGMKTKKTKKDVIFLKMK